MLNRAVVQPDPVVALGLAADTMAAAATAESLDDLFLRLEAAGVMLRIDRDVVPTMAKTPTLGGRGSSSCSARSSTSCASGTSRQVTRREIVLRRWLGPARARLARRALRRVGLQYPPLVPIWGPDKIRLQTIRAGFPCFNAALAGYVEATRDDDRERNRLCPPNTLPDTPDQLGADAGARHHRRAHLRRRARHRRVGERMRAEPGARSTANSVTNLT